MSSEPSTTLISDFLADPWSVSLADRRIIRFRCEQNYLFFARLFFRVRENQQFGVSWHHELLAEAMQSVVAGKYKRLLINCPPGYTKTELVVSLFIPWSLAVNRKSRMIHISSSDSLVYANSLAARDVILSEQYRSLWGYEIRNDIAAKKRWFIEGAGGGVLAVPSGGQITGFRAGHMTPGLYSGALIIDDPIKPGDAFSDSSRRRINTRLPNTIRSRLALEETPIVIIMQRLHDDDLTGYVLRGGTGDVWDHLCLPVHADEPAYDYPPDYTHVRAIPYDRQSVVLWAAKHNAEQIQMLKQHAYTYASQYAQRPAPLGGGEFKSDWWRYYDHYDAARNELRFCDDSKPVRLQGKYIFADTAVKVKTHNDFSVAQCWGFDGNRIFLLDQIRGKWEAPDLRRQFLQFCDRHAYCKGSVALGVRDRYVEDKVSGSGLIQDMCRERGSGFVRGIQRDTDKVSRARGAAPALEAGKVWLPRHPSWVADYVYEFSQFTAEMSHAHDDQIDPTLDAISHLLITRQGVNYRAMMGKR